jgi:dienelactone hydrolase
VATARSTAHRRYAPRVLAAALAAACLGAVSAPAGAGGLDRLGVYRLDDGDVVSIVLAAKRLRLVDYGSGALRSLRPVGPWSYVGGPGASVLWPARVHVRFDADGGIDVDGRPGKLMPIVSEPLSFDDGPVRLAGRLLRPAGPGPFPAVVLVPGSEPAHRTTHDLWAYFFAAHGLAVLTYDKRGVGASGGTYDRSAATANLERLAADALAGVARLRGLPFVDAARIGLVGESQAGWVIEMAAARSSSVRFAALASAPAMSVGRQLAYADLTRQGWLVPPPSPAEIASSLGDVRDSGYDPRRAIASLRIPVLWQLGSVDKRMRTSETLATLHRIEASGRHDFTIRVYRGGAHSLRLTEQGLVRQEQHSPGFVPAVFRDLAAWLRARGLGH